MKCYLMQENATVTAFFIFEFFFRTQIRVSLTSEILHRVTSNGDKTVGYVGKSE